MPEVYQISECIKPHSLMGALADGFFIERHPKLDPVATMTDGVFIAGCCQSPKDIPDTVAQASAAATRVLAGVPPGQDLPKPMTERKALENISAYLLGHPCLRT